MLHIQDMGKQVILHCLHGSCRMSRVLAYKTPQNRSLKMQDHMQEHEQQSCKSCRILYNIAEKTSVLAHLVQEHKGAATGGAMFHELLLHQK